MDYYSFQSSVSLLDIQTLYDLRSYNKTISFLTINQDEIDKILGCMFLRKLCAKQNVCFVPCLMRLFSCDGIGRCERMRRKEDDEEKKDGTKRREKNAIK